MLRKKLFVMTTVVATAGLIAGGVAVAQPSENGFSVEAVESESVELPAGTQDDPGVASATVECPDGTVVTGGGGSPEGTGQAALIASFPLSLSEWTVDYVNFGDADQITANVFCAPEDAGVVGVQSDNVDLPAGTQDEPGVEAVTAECPAGTTATGGGASPGADGLPLMVSSFPSSFTEWTADYVNFGEAGVIAAYIFCAPEDAGIEGVQSETVELPEGTEDEPGQAVVTAECPDGTTVTGGGASPGANGQPLMVSTFPSSSTEWSADYVNFGEAGELAAYVFCAPGGSGTSDLGPVSEALGLIS